jgi:chitin disaccharide deacetylase
VRTPKRLIVNADDFGMSTGVNRGIIEAHERGIVTSTSLMVRWPGAAEAASYARYRDAMSVGLHVDLGEWVYREGSWTPIYEVVPLNDPAAVWQEITAQLAAFRHIVGRSPTHLDSHQHVHLRDPVRATMLELAQNLRAPLRHFIRDVRYCGSFYGQTTEGQPLPEAIAVDALVAVLHSLPEGTTELACHPGWDEHLNTMYAHERGQEVRTLCSDEVQSAVRSLDIQLCCFGDLVPSDQHAPDADKMG